jgi:hypothetical protein
VYSGYVEISRRSKKSLYEAPYINAIPVQPSNAVPLPNVLYEHLMCAPGYKPLNSVKLQKTIDSFRLTKNDRQPQSRMAYDEASPR